MDKAKGKRFVRISEIIRDAIKEKYSPRYPYFMLCSTHAHVCADIARLDEIIV